MINADNIIRATNLGENPELIPKKVSLVTRKFETPHKKASKKSKLVENLAENNEHLVKNLENLRSTANCLKDMEQFKSVSSLVNELADLEHQVETEKSYLEDLMQQIRKIENLKKKQTKRLGGKYNASHVDDVKELDKSRERWQEKLRVESVHLGNELAKNKELREKIRCMMSERANVNKEYDGLLERLTSGKKIMQDIVEGVKVAEVQRSNILKKIDKINLQEKKQIALQEEEAYNLTLRRDNERELNKFYYNKQKERPSEKNRQEKNKSGLTADETVLHNNRSLLLEIIENSEEFSEVNSDAGLEPSTYDGVIKRFKNNENEIWSLFKYATHLNHEMEVLKDKLAEQGKQVNEMISDQEMTTIDHEDELRYLTALKAKVEEEEMVTQDEIRGAERMLARLFEAIENLISTTKADVSPLLLLLGEKVKITVFNYKIFMEALETKLVEIMNSTPLPISPMSPSLVSFSKRVNNSKAKRTNPYGSFDSKTVITSPCHDCAAHKKDIEDLSKLRVGNRVKVQN